VKVQDGSSKQVNDAGSTGRVEPRTPLVLTISMVLLLFSFMPDRARFLPSWVGLAVGIALILLIVGVRLGGNRARWLRVERAAALTVASSMLAITLLIVAFLVAEIVREPTKFGGKQLLTAGIEAWVTNILAFSIVYWDVDRGGPENRINRPAELPDWLFPQTGVPNEVAPEWRPSYVDYLFLAFSTATAFSTTDVVPLTRRAKLLMMLESCISLATLAIVASRAINVLGN
jgi:hypothetical protein